MSTVQELQQDLARAQAEEEARQAREEAEHQRREIAAATERLAAYDRNRYTAEANEAWQRVLQAFEETPVFVALADAQAARWRAHRAAHAAVAAQTTIARARGDELPRLHDGGPPDAITPDTLIRVLDAMLRTRMDADEEREQEAHLAAVAHNLTPEQARKVDEHLDAGRAAHEEPRPTSIDVTGMTDPEREALGLPTGSTRPERRY